MVTVLVADAGVANRIGMEVDVEGLELDGSEGNDNKLCSPLC